MCEYPHVLCSTVLLPTHQERHRYIQVHTCTFLYPHTCTYMYMYLPHTCALTCTLSIPEYMYERVHLPTTYPLSKYLNTRPAAAAAAAASLGQIQ